MRAPAVRALFAWLTDLRRALETLPGSSAGADLARLMAAADEAIDALERAARPHAEMHDELVATVEQREELRARVAELERMIDAESARRARRAAVTLGPPLEFKSRPGDFEIEPEGIPGALHLGESLYNLVRTPPEGATAVHASGEQGGADEQPSKLGPEDETPRIGIRCSGGNREKRRNRVNRTIPCTLQESAKLPPPAPAIPPRGDDANDSPELAPKIGPGGSFEKVQK